MSTAHQRTPDPDARASDAVPGDDDPVGRLARHLLPALVHGVNNHTQFLTGLNAVLALSSDGRVLHDRAGDLAQVAREVEDAGWLLALVASGSGSNLMLARREPRGLAIVSAWVDHALRRAGAARIAGCAERTWPELTPLVLEGWQLPWAIGSLLLAAGLDGTGAGSFELELRSGAASGEPGLLLFPAGPRVEELVPIVCGLLEGARMESEGDRMRLSLPDGWLAFAGSEE